jgi:hypothetical protein
MPEPSTVGGCVVGVVGVVGGGVVPAGTVGV